jgi:hypothetical protein
MSNGDPAGYRHRRISLIHPLEERKWGQEIEIARVVQTNTLLK